jgi:hypothetical protein
MVAANMGCGWPSKHSADAGLQSLMRRAMLNPAPSGFPPCFMVFQFTWATSEAALDPHNTCNCWRRYCEHNAGTSVTGGLHGLREPFSARCNPALGLSDPIRFYKPRDRRANEI